MTKQILIIVFASLVAWGTPTLMRATHAIEIIDNESQTPVISVTGSSLRIVGANGQSVSIFNVTGVRVLAFKVEGNDKHYELSLPKGCYIIKVGKTVRKVSIS